LKCNRRPGSPYGGGYATPGYAPSAGGYATPGYAPSGYGGYATPGPAYGGGYAASGPGYGGSAYGGYGQAYGGYGAPGPEMYQTAGEGQPHSLQLHSPQLYTKQLVFCISSLINCILQPFVHLFVSVLSISLPGNDAPRSYKSPWIVEV